MSDEALRAELVKKAKKAGVKVTPEMDAAAIEEALALAAIAATESAPEPETTPETTMAAGTVKCRVTKAGDGKVFTGNGNETYKWNDMIVLPLRSLKALKPGTLSRSSNGQVLG